MPIAEKTVSLQLLREQHADAVKEAGELLKLEAPDESQISRIEELLSTAENRQRQILLRERSTLPSGQGHGTTGTGNGITTLPGGAVLLSNQAKVVDYIRQHRQPSIDPSELSLGRYVGAKITGRWKQDAPAEYELAQGGFDNSAGGHLVPDELASFVIDKARSQAVIMQAGAGTIPMTSDSLRIPTVATDPTISGKAENAAWTETSVVFGSLLLAPITFGAVLRTSRELWDDSPLASSTFERTLSASLAVHLDRLAIQGSGAGVEFLSLKSHPDVLENTSLGAISWEDLAEGVRKIEDENGTPTALVMAPKTREDLSLVLTGDATNSTKGWLGSPSTVADLPRFSTTGCPDDEVYAGDFTQAVFGLRMSPEIRISEHGDAFPRFQLLIRIAWRGTFALLRPTHFWRGTGLTH